MLKLKKIEISGFRGILDKQQLDFGTKNPSSMAIFGLNSTGKSSFIDGIEWFLSESNEIGWLKRENAGGRAYPHQEAKPDTSFVEIEFYDDLGKLNTLKKSYNHNRVTMPNVSSLNDFTNLYSSFVVKPFLRYQEIIEFVFNRTGVQKYETLAKWMGFEDELRFQEKIALKIIPQIQEKERELSLKVQGKKDELAELASSIISFNDEDVLKYLNQSLEEFKIGPFLSLNELKQAISKANSKKVLSKKQEKYVLLNSLKSSVSSIQNNENINEQNVSIFQKIKGINDEKDNLKKINYLQLYEHALNILNEQNELKILCPLCGNEWERANLINEIKEKFDLINQIKIEKEKLDQAIQEFIPLLESEQQKIREIQGFYKSLMNYFPINNDKLSDYESCLKNLIATLRNKPLGLIKLVDLDEKGKKARLEKEDILEKIQKEIDGIGIRKETMAQEEVFEKANKILELFEQLKNWQEAESFYSKEVEKFKNICNELSEKIQTNIQERFKKISKTIESYFKILRADKDIKDIQLELNTDTFRAIGRSAEIKLSYFDLEVKPAYKVLSESLLNSLGLAVYFTCVKEFNSECKFIVLDDVMNSLDTGHRDSLLDLIEQMFKDYQVIILTHDEFWFQKIQRRFPQWKLKKIKNWSYLRGPVIERTNTTLQDIEDLLKDNTKAREAGYKLSLYIEDSLNELCESIHAELRYRYYASNPPTLDELFTAFLKRIKKVAGNNTILISSIEAVQKSEPLLRNFSDHSKSNFTTSISPTEVERVKNDWNALERIILCNSCNKYISYSVLNKSFECKCRLITLSNLQ